LCVLKHSTTELQPHSESPLFEPAKGVKHYFNILLRSLKVLNFLYKFQSNSYLYYL
jgi:hypothetical protein